MYSSTIQLPKTKNKQKKKTRRELHNFKCFDQGQNYAFLAENIGVVAPASWDHKSAS